MSIEPESHIESVRRRPAMYFAGTDESGLDSLFGELISNCLDAYLIGTLSRVRVGLDARGALGVADDGPGISREVGSDGLTFLERVFTRPHATPTADGHAPHVHVGASGVGLALVCAVCSHVEVRVEDTQGAFVQTFSRGRAMSALSPVACEGAGTRVTIRPDREVFETVDWDVSRIDKRLRELAHLCPGLALSLEVAPRAYGPGASLAGMVERLVRGQPLHPEVFTCSAADGLMQAGVAMCWSDAPGDARVDSFCNLEPTTSGGTHVNGFAQGVVRALQAASESELTGNAWRARYDRLSRGLVAVVSVTLIDPTYGAPTKNTLLSAPVGALVARAVVEGLTPALEREAGLRRTLLGRLR